MDAPHGPDRYPVEELDRAWEDICKHCDDKLLDCGTYHVHANGAHEGKVTCALEPYGFQAESHGSTCSTLPANPCNGASGIAPRR